MQDSPDNFVRLEIVYTDPPDLIELGVTVRTGGWAAFSKAYADPSEFVEQARALVGWSASPSGRSRIEAGADTGIGWMRLEFYTINSAKHVCCAASLATGDHSRGRPEQTWRFMVELQTELGLVERFARECIAMSADASPYAMLTVVPS